MGTGRENLAGKAQKIVCQENLLKEGMKNSENWMNIKAIHILRFKTTYEDDNLSQNLTGKV